MTNSERLYQMARGLLGVNLSPGNEKLGCALSMSAVYNKTFPDREPLRFVNTTQWYNFLKDNPLFSPLEKPESDCIIVSVTDMIPSDSPLTGDKRHGHVGIVGRLASSDGSKYIMSNDSSDFCWNTQMTETKWNDYFVRYGKVPTFYYKVI